MKNIMTYKGYWARIEYSDRDLYFLADCKNEDLKTLVDIMTHDKDGNVRLTEELTVTDAYLQCYPHNLRNMWRYIADELQHFGGNTIANVCRREGVSYRTILEDVCKKMKVYFSDFDKTEEIEKYLLKKLCSDAVNKMSDSELRDMCESLEIPTKSPKKYMVAAAIQMAIRRGGALFGRIAIYITRMITEVVLGRGAMIVGANFLNKAFGFFTGPIGWLITAGWAIYDLASPAYRVTVPCVVQIACMRMQLDYSK